MARITQITYKTGKAQKERLQAVAVMLGEKLGFSKPLTLSDALDYVVREAYDRLIKDPDCREALEREVEDPEE